MSNAQMTVGRVRTNAWSILFFEHIKKCSFSSNNSIDHHCRWPDRADFSRLSTSLSTSSRRRWEELHDLSDLLDLLNNISRRGPRESSTRSERFASQSSIPVTARTRSTLLLFRLFSRIDQRDENSERKIIGVSGAGRNPRKKNKDKNKGIDESR